MKMPGCLPNHIGGTQWAYWVPGFIFEFTLFTLAIVKLLQTAHAQNKPPRVMAVLLRDSVLYYGGVLSTMICGLVTWSTVRVRIKQTLNMLASLNSRCRASGVTSVFSDRVRH